MDFPLGAAGLGVAAAGMASGLVYRTPAAAAADRQVFEAINAARLGPIADGAFVALRWLGTAWPVVILAVGLAVRSLWLGVSFGVGALVAGIVERGIKAIVRRQRPFEVLPAVRVLQLPPPKDPSYPSADASRVWFLAVGIGVATAWSVWVMAIGAALAVVVSLGRVRLGVHYPLDVWAGACLGLGLGLMWASFLAR